MKLAPALAAIFVCGCAATEMQPPQGVFIEIQHDSLASVVSECGKTNIGCARWTGFNANDRCEIHYRAGDMNTRYHEIKHCVKGYYH